MNEGPVVVCECGHDELDHGRLSKSSPHTWGCSECGCPELRPKEMASG